MKKFKFDKLIRDKLLKKMRDKGIIVHIKHIDSHEEILSYFKAKVVEESREILSASTREELIEEIADITEVLDELLKRSRIDPAEIEHARLTKSINKGGFSNAIVVDTVEINPENEFTKYYSENPDKYPELI